MPFKTNRLFTYGTLMRGYSNNYILGASKFIGPAITKDKFQMYAWGYPFLIEKAETWEGYPVGGELYEITEHTLRRTDHLEGHPVMYKREKRMFLRVAYDQLDNHHDAPIEAWVYIYQYPQRFADDQKARIEPNPEGILQWSRPSLRIEALA